VLEAKYRSGMGQFLTPPNVASLLAGMFQSAEGEVRLLDPGAGVGTLTAAFVEEILGRRQKPRSLHLTVWEAEKEFIGRLEQVLEGCVEAGRAAGVPTSYVLNHGDMLRDGVELLEEEDLFRAPRRSRGFTHAIMNPPYRKINTDSEARLLLRRAGLETSNLYTGFLWLAARLLEPEGQIVAITPRSFCNGPYFLPFREQFFDLMALERLHVFDRRDALFAGDDVLQENLIMYARRSAQRRTSVVLSSSDGLPAGAARSRTVPHSRVMDPADSSRVVHVALEVADDEAKGAVMAMPATLAGLGIDVSTGRVVDFRARDFLRMNPEDGTLPLIYPGHFNEGCVYWPCPGSRKPNALLSVPETQELLVPNGDAGILKRLLLLRCDSLAVRGVDVKDFKAGQEVGHVNLAGCGDEALVWCSDLCPGGFGQMLLDGGQFVQSPSDDISDVQSFAPVQLAPQVLYTLTISMLRDSQAGCQETQYSLSVIGVSPGKIIGVSPRKMTKWDWRLAVCACRSTVTVRRSRLSLRVEGVAGWWGETTIINNPHGPATSHLQRDRWDSQRSPP